MWNKKVDEKTDEEYREQESKKRKQENRIRMRLEAENGIN